jgi:type IV secretory pathway VirB2 component (pilin)
VPRWYPVPTTCSDTLSTAVPRRSDARAGREPFAFMNRQARSELLQMMGLVAAVVAIVILVFFGLGYLFGRLFL